MSLFLSHYNDTHQLGGEGRVVQIDESCFAAKSKYNRGRHAKQKNKWVFGITEKHGM